MSFSPPRIKINITATKRSMMITITVIALWRCVRSLLDSNFSNFWPLIGRSKAWSIISYLNKYADISSLFKICLSCHGIGSGMAIIEKKSLLVNIDTIRIFAIQLSLFSTCTHFMLIKHLHGFAKCIMQRFVHLHETG